MSKGVVLSVSSTSLFAGLYYYATLLHPLNGEEIYGLRMLLTLPFVTLFMMLSKEWHRVGTIIKRMRDKPSLVLGVIVSSALLGVQQWLFLWAPLNGSALQVSLGYFLLPLTMLAVGRILYREQPSSLQKIAGFIAALGVGHAVYQAGAFSWEALLVCLGFPAYFVLRKTLSTDNLGGLWFDMLCTLPVALWFIFRTPSTIASFSDKPSLYALVLILAAVSAAAFMCYVVASKLLPFSLFGLLGYVEPVLMVLVALVLGEQIGADEWFTYVPIWAAVGILVLDGLRHIRASGRVPALA